MRVLVTGGAGFIGSALVRRLVLSGEHIVSTVDALTYAGNLDSLESISASGRHRFFHADICNESRIREIFDETRPECVFHLAAESHVDRSIDGPKAFVETNVVGTYVMLQEALRFWRGLLAADSANFRFVHVSTDEVFGSLGETGHFSETTAYDPSSPYSATKAASDHLVRAWHRTYGLPTLITNCSNNYGPYQFPEKLIPHMIVRALAGESLPVYGTGQNTRDWLHVDDHAAALECVARSGRVGETYLVSGRQEAKNLDVVHSLCRALDSLHPRTDGKSYQTQIAFVTDRPGHDFRYAIDATKLETELGWRATRLLDDGLSATVQWYLDHRGWWDRILSGDYRVDRQGLTETR